MKKIEMDKSEVIWDKIIVMLFFLLGLIMTIIENDRFFMIIASLNIFLRLVEFIQILRK